MKQFATQVISKYVEYAKNKKEHTRKFHSVAVLAEMKIPSMFNLLKSSIFCSPRMFKGVTMIWIPCGQNKSGIQNVKVLPLTVATSKMTSWPHKIAVHTWTCHRHGEIGKIRIESGSQVWYWVEMWHTFCQAKWLWPGDGHAMQLGDTAQPTRAQVIQSPNGCHRK